MFMVLWVLSVHLNYTQGLIHATNKLQKLPKQETFMLALCFQIQGKRIIICDPVTVFHVLKLKNKVKNGKYLRMKVTILKSEMTSLHFFTFT